MQLSRVRGRDPACWDRVDQQRASRETVRPLLMPPLCRKFLRLHSHLGTPPEYRLSPSDNSKLTLCAAKVNPSSLFPDLIQHVHTRHANRISSQFPFIF